MIRSNDIKKVDCLNAKVLIGNQLLTRHASLMASRTEKHEPQPAVNQDNKINDNCRLGVYNDVAPPIFFNQSCPLSIFKYGFDPRAVRPAGTLPGIQDK